MVGRSLNFSFRGEILALVICVVLSLSMLLLPADTRIVVADRLALVMTSPYWNARNYGEDVFRIRDENARLKERVVELEFLAASGDRMQRDAEHMVGPALDPGFDGELVPCRVIKRQRSRFATMIKVRSSAPVAWKPWMPVISRSGYLGRLRLVVNEHDAWVELLSAPDFALGVEIERTGLLGVLRPRGDRFVVEMVGRDEDVQPGDSIITSGIAEIRDLGRQEEAANTQRGFPVGTVTAATSPSDKIFKEIIVAPAASFDRNETVFVVTPPETGVLR
jgi:cell shape-determining protein MreC